uniref:hypothetical protein n=1 Tax=Burkholderia gladioli TaxID=28095 RepID=UPI003F68A2E9
LLSTMLSYFQRRARREPSVPYLDLVQADWSRATGMKRDQLDRARSALRVLHMVSETRMGLPPRVTVSINLAVIAERLSEPVRPRPPGAVAARAAGAERDAVGSRPTPLDASRLPSLAATRTAKTRAPQQQSGSAHLVFTNSPSCIQDSCNLPARFPQISLRDFHTSACRMTANQYAGLPQILYRGLLTTSLRLQPPSSGRRPMDPRGSRRSGGEQYGDNGPSPDQRPAAGLEVVSAVDVDGGAGIPAPADGEPRESLSVATESADALIVPAFEIPTLERSARSLIGHWPAPAKVKQEVLDELAGALHAGRVRNPVRYLQSLIAAADNHRFVPALGPAIAAARRRAASLRASLEAAESALRDQLAATPEVATQAWARSKSADASLATIRDLVGIRRKGDP